VWKWNESENKVVKVKRKWKPYFINFGSLVRIYSLQYISNNNLSLLSISLYAKYRCEQKIKEIKSESEIEKKNIIWNCDLQIGKNADLWKKYQKEWVVWIGYDTIDWMRENLTKGNECDQKYMSTKYSQDLEKRTIFEEMYWFIRRKVNINVINPVFWSLKQRADLF
jgi:hypothetical protein